MKMIVERRMLHKLPLTWLVVFSAETPPALLHEDRYRRTFRDLSYNWQAQCTFYLLFLCTHLYSVYLLCGCLLCDLCGLCQVPLWKASSALLGLTRGTSSSYCVTASMTYSYRKYRGITMLKFTLLLYQSDVFITWSKKKFTWAQCQSKFIISHSSVWNYAKINHTAGAENLYFASSYIGAYNMNPFSSRAAPQCTLTFTLTTKPHTNCLSKLLVEVL